ncbi:MAG TPA: hypothetical protein VN982_08110 [Candidatus Dormibacteraeota bacterium]|nr:hypothetical protein [Candidatus Dormibacteraeota bacterium]
MKVHLTIFLMCGFYAAGCGQHPMTDYRPLGAAGMGSSTVEDLKTLNTSDAEVIQLVHLKQGGITDDTCVALVRAAHANQHPFNSADWTVNLKNARFKEQQIVEFAQADKLDSIGGEAVTLKLVGLSEPTVTTLLQRRLRGQTTLDSAQIGRLKNTGLTENQILQQIDQGITDEVADKEIKARESARNHANTGFVRNRGRIAR